MHNQEKKWAQYKDFLIKQIHINKKLGKQSFDYILRQNDIKMPKAVNFIPEDKSKWNKFEHKKRKGKEELHR